METEQEKFWKEINLVRDIIMIIIQLYFKVN